MDKLEVVAWRCSTCNAPRSKSPCHKCGGELTRACDGWEEPLIPDIDRVRALAREVGYAIGVHGSLERDVDLIAVPWVEEAVGPEALAERISSGLPGSIVAVFDDAAYGRRGFNIQADGWFKLIDLSVMTPTTIQYCRMVAAVRELTSLGCSAPKPIGCKIDAER